MVRRCNSWMRARDTIALTLAYHDPNTLSRERELIAAKLEGVHAAVQQTHGGERGFLPMMSVNSYPPGGALSANNDRSTE